MDTQGTEETVQLSYKANTADVAAAFRSVLAHNRMVQVIYVMLALFLWATFGFTLSGLALAAAIMIAFCLGAGYVVGILRASKRKTISVTVSQMGVTIKGTQAESRLEWSAFTTLVDHKQRFLLHIRHRTVFPIPKRAFGSPEQLADFKRICAAHVPAH